MLKSNFTKPSPKLPYAEAAASGSSGYNPGGGLKSVGLGGAVTWKVTDPMTASLFGEYSRLEGPAADSSLVRESGDRNQFTVGVSIPVASTFRSSDSTLYSCHGIG